MKIAASFFPIALALGATTLTPGLVRAQDFREEGPIEIEKCQTIDKSGSYKLVKNLTLTGTTLPSICLEITTDFVTIDLAGFTISVTGPIFSTAILTLSPSGGQVVGTAVRNGSISLSVGDGVDLGSDSIVEELRISGTGGSARGISATGIVRGNTVQLIGNSPLLGVGISATGIVTGNFVEGNGIGMEIGRGSTVIGNTASSNRRLGISVDCPSNVTNNTAVDTVEGPNLVLTGDGCNNTNNVAP